LVKKNIFFLKTPFVVTVIFQGACSNRIFCFIFFYMFVKKVKRPNNSISIQIVENTRVGEKVVQKVIRHMGQYVNEKEIEKVANLAETLIIEMKNSVRPALPGFEAIMHTPAKKKITSEDEMVSVKGLKEEKRINKGIEDVFGKSYEQLGLFDILDKGYKQNESNQILREVVLSRLSLPVSKRKTVKVLDIDKDVQIPLEKVYRMMDKVFANEQQIKKKIGDSTLALFKQKVDVAFFDVTTLYFESFTPDELRNFGFSKDNKFKETQVMLALITTTEGLPLGYELFPGNTYEGSTLIKVIDDVKKNYDISNTFIIADRAMFTRNNLNALDERQVKFIVAAKLKTLNHAKKNEIVAELQAALSENSEIDYWQKDFIYEERRLVVSYDKKRANKDKHDRERLVERIKKKMKDGKVRLADLINNTGTKKYLTIEKKGSKEATLNESKIASEELWDGIHGVITNHCDIDLSSAQVLMKYKELWQIEAAFRVNKHDLKMRPIFHWKPLRIKAHILICFMAYSVATHVRYKLQKSHIKLSFEEIRDELNRLQVSIVRDEKSGKQFSLPSKITKNQQQIYQALGLRINQKTKML
jgi:transposase